MFATRYYAPMTHRKVWLSFFALVLIVANGCLLYVFLHRSDDLRVTFLNVGQGDSVLIEAPTGEQVLIDGGPDRSVLRELPKVIGPLDRSIDLLIATHPDKDHIAGLADVFARYEVLGLLEPDVQSDTSYAQALSYAASTEKGANTITARRGMRIHIGEEVYADVLFPDRDVELIETNTGSIIVQLVYGDTEFMLSGDSPLSIENWLVALDGEELESDVLKAGHHGSRTSTSEAWIQAVAPSYVVVSAGDGNSYGHPHKEVVERITASGAQMLSTMKGSVSFVSDGKTVRVK